MPEQLSIEDAALSRHTYLDDLLRYIARHLKNNGQEVASPAFLAALLHQPFASLLAFPEAGTAQMRQVRIAVEVLRGYIACHPSPPERAAELAEAEGQYRLAAYTLLLETIGISFTELRLAAGGSEAERVALAARAGLPADADQFSRLLLDPDAGPADPEALTEERLESLFGLKDTHGDPVCNGVKRGDDHNQLVRWHLAQAIWNRDTDLQGEVYLTLDHDPATLTYRASLYRDPEREQLVAQGETPDRQGRIVLTPLHGHHLTGVLEIAYGADTASVTLNAVPLYTSLRLAHLRLAWIEQDRSGPPALDPDAVPEGAATSAPAQHLLQERRVALAARKAALQAVQAGAAAPPDRLDMLLQAGLGLTLAGLDRLVAQQRDGEEIEATLAQYHLSGADFVVLAQLHRLAALPGARLQSAEWSMVEDMALRAFKQQQAEAWRYAEQAAQITLSPDHFAPLTATRAGWDERLARIERRAVQEQEILLGITAGLAAVEAEALPPLREALVAASGAPGDTPAAQAAWLSDRLYIDIRTAGTQSTSRIEQAIESVLGLLFDLRSGQVDSAAWPRWFPLAGHAALPPGAMLGGAQQYLFFAGQDGNVYGTRRDASGRWGNWIPIGATSFFSVPPGAPVSALLRSPDQIEVFVTGSDGAVYTTRRAPGEWGVVDHFWTRIGATINFIVPPGSAITAVSRQPETIDLFVTGSDNAVYTTWWTPAAGWESGHNWSQIGSGIAFTASPGATVTAAADTPERIDLFVTGSDNAVYTTWWTPADGWEPGHNWSRIGATLAVPPHALSSTIGHPDFRRDLFVVDGDGTVQRAEWRQATGWSDWNALGNAIAAPGTSVGVFGFVDGWITLLVAGADGAVYTLQRTDEVNWETEWQRLGDTSLPAQARLTMLAVNLQIWQAVAVDSTGQIVTTWRNTNVELEAPHFDTEWLWIGSYASWRAAMAVYLRPELMLQPYLFRARTPAFEHLLRQTRAIQALDSAGALRLLTEYEEAIVEISALKVEGCMSGRDRLYFVGCSNSGTIYWSSCAWPTTTEPDLEAWAPIPALATAQVVRLVGLVRGVLFCIVTENHQERLACVLFDPPQGWGGLTVLETPPILGMTGSNPTAFDIVPVQSMHTALVQNTEVAFRQKDTGNVLIGQFDRQSRTFRTFRTMPLSLTQLLGIASVPDVTFQSWVWHVFTVTPTGLLAYQPFWENGNETAAEAVLGPSSLLGLLPAPDGSLTVFYRKADGHIVCRSLFRAGGATPQAPELPVALGDFSRVVPHSVLDSDAHPGFAYERVVQDEQTVRYALGTRLAEHALRQFTASILPVHTMPLWLLLRDSQALTDTGLQQRRAATERAATIAATWPRRVRGWMLEAQYLAPLHLALQLQGGGQYAAALDWFRAVYDYRAPTGRRAIYAGLDQEASLPEADPNLRGDDWLLDPLDPHTIAAHRRHAYTRYTVSALARCLLDYADAEFTRDSGESRGRARALYLLVPDVLNRPELHAASLFEPLLLHAEVHLEQLRTGRNIAGMQRRLDGDSSPTGTLMPTLYRYRVLVERARQLVDGAVQVEGAMLAALEKRDAEAFNVLSARQAIELSEARVRLQDLRLEEAKDATRLAFAQRERAVLHYHYYATLYHQNMSQMEKDAIQNLLIAEKNMDLAQRIAIGITTAWQRTDHAANLGNNSYTVNYYNYIMNEMGALTGRQQLTATIDLMIASFERRRAEWAFQRDLAYKDTMIANQQILHTYATQAVIRQDRAIAGIQAQNSRDTFEFLSGKFTGVTLYEWLSETLERIYRFFLQQATAMAKLAENQLAFERQEPPARLIGADYWVPPEATGVPEATVEDRKGLTGSVRLLRDLVMLDQYAFTTARRKLRLNKTFSLASLAPIEFQQFRETGVLPFTTTLDMFDRDFPGQYLRLIKRVRLSLIALVPPGLGVRATLASTGISRVVLGPLNFQTVLIRREPELISITEPLDMSPLEAREAETEMLLPFEGNGVEMGWEFQLPRAANLFDFSSIADIFFTIEYSALQNDAYRRRVIESLPATVRAERAISFRRELADQWYDLHNPDQVEPERRMLASFRTGPEQFPPNLHDMKIEQVTLAFARATGQAFEVEIAALRFTPDGATAAIGGGPVITHDGIAGTRRSNAAAWEQLIEREPYGEWQLALPDTEAIRNLFVNEAITDMLFVLTYRASLPAWPGV